MSITPCNINLDAVISSNEGFYVYVNVNKNVYFIFKDCRRIIHSTKGSCDIWHGKC